MLKYTKFGNSLSAGAPVQTPLGELIHRSIPMSPAVFKGPNSKEREGGETDKKGEERKGGGKKRCRERFGPPKNFGMAPLCQEDTVQQVYSDYLV